jgi:L-galactose dehydrogenase
VQYRSLGKTGLSVSKLGFGASPLGGSFGPIDEAEGIRAVYAAFDLGVNIVDVSPYYGQTRAENVLGRALKSVDRDRFVLATKVGRFGPADFDFSAERIARSCEESLRRLNVETIDLFQCHDIEFVDLPHVIEEAIPAMRRLQEQGKVRFIGVTGYPLNVYRQVLSRTDLDVILSYCHYTLFDTSLVDLVPLLESRGVGVLNAAPYSMGLLTDRTLPDWHPAPPELREACRRTAEAARAQGRDIAELALQFSLAEERIASTFVGMATTEDVRRNVAWSVEPPDADALAAIQPELESVRGMTWPSGRPENQ